MKKLPEIVFTFVYVCGGLMALGVAINLLGWPYGAAFTITGLLGNALMQAIAAWPMYRFFYSPLSNLNDQAETTDEDDPDPQTEKPGVLTQDLEAIVKNPETLRPLHLSMVVWLCLPAHLTISVGLAAHLAGWNALRNPLLLLGTPTMVLAGFMLFMMTREPWTGFRRYYFDRMMLLPFNILLFMIFILRVHTVIYHLFIGREG